MNKTEQLKEQSKEAIHSIQELAKQLRLSQQSYKATSAFYPPALDIEIEELNRDISCLIRRWNIFSSRLEKIKEKENQDTIDNVEIMEDFKNLRILYIQSVSKIDNIIFEFKSIDKIDRNITDNSDIFDEFDDFDDYDKHE